MTWEAWLALGVAAVTLGFSVYAVWCIRGMWK
jgi:hypothetical protein